jgi:hypothetical protein
MVHPRNNAADDFKELLNAQKAISFEEIKTRFGTIAANGAANGTLRSSRIFIVFAQEAGEVIEKFVQSSIDDLSQFKQSSEIPTSEIIDAIRLNALELKMQSTKVKNFQNLVNSLKMPHLTANYLKAIEPSENRTAVMLRRLALGISTTGGANTVTVTNNTINTKNINGPVVQGESNKISYEVSTLRVEEIKAVISQIEAQISQQDNSRELIDLQGDIETIKLQLNKSVPSKSVLTSAAESMKTIGEGAIGGALGSQLAPLFTSLLSIISQ